jgi:purine-binding chemotaxis protein CheW
MTTQAILSEQQLVVFDLGKESYGVEVSTVLSIIRMQEVTAVPNTAEYVEGVINLRGKVIPVVDLRKRFGLEATEHTKDTRIVVVGIGQHDIGVIVDSVTEVQRIPAEAIESQSSVATIQRSEFLMGIAKTEDRMIILLDLASMLSQEDAEAVDQVEEEAA